MKVPTMKVMLRLKNEKEVFQKLERANELIGELMNIFQGYAGSGKEIEIEAEYILDPSKKEERE